MKNTAIKISPIGRTNNKQNNIVGRDIPTFKSVFLFNFLISK